MRKKKDVIHKDLLIRSLEYCYPKEEFTIDEIQIALSLTTDQRAYLERFGSGTEDSPKQMFERFIRISPAGDRDHYYRLTPTAIFHYLEYVELVEAKRNAIQSKKIALWAILVSALAIIIPMIINFINSFKVRV